MKLYYQPAPVLVEHPEVVPHPPAAQALLPMTKPAPLTLPERLLRRIR